MNEFYTPAEEDLRLHARYFARSVAEWYREVFLLSGCLPNEIPPTAVLRIPEMVIPI